MNGLSGIATSISLLLALSASAAFAHCFLDHSTPASGDMAVVPPARVVLFFDNPFNPDATTVRVLSQAGEQVSGNPAASADRRALTAPLKPVAPGQYFVKWRATSLDGDRTTGAYSFTVKAAQ